MRPIFIDFEASGLGPGSWPIEIGFAWIADGQVHSGSCLIRPDPGWSPDAWSPASAAVHGIPRSALDDAEPALAVARWAVATIADRVPVSDAPELDQHWLNCLIDTDPTLGRPVIRDFDAFVARRFKAPALFLVYETLDHEVAPHRVEADARRLAKAWLAGVNDPG